MAKFINYQMVWNMLENLGGCGAKPDTWEDGWDQAINTAIGELENMPAADVQEVRREKWIKSTTSVCRQRTDKDGNPLLVEKIFYTCSECNYGTVVKSQFCPNCGARMDGEK